jgi:hypothetical protein
VGDKSRLIAVAPLTGVPHIGKQRWVGSHMKRCRLLSPNMSSRLLWLVSGPEKCMGLETPGAESLLIDYLKILHWAVIIGAWLLY